MTSPAAPWSSYLAAVAYLDDALIRQRPIEHPGDPTRRGWMEQLLERLGAPQLHYEAVHLAATSGKGSTAAMIAEVLRAAGKRVGLHTSPFVQVATEKFWVDGSYARAEELLELTRWVRPHAEALRRPEVPLHALASTACVLEHFRRQGVELAVVEVGVGGRDDTTNVLKTSVAVVGAVGLDHQRVLGHTLEEIATHKAGIIRPGCRAVVLDGPARPAAEAQAHAVGAPLRVVTASEVNIHPTHEPADPLGCVTFGYRGRRLTLDGLRLGLAGVFQAQNAALALAALEELDPHGAFVDEAAVRTGLARARLPGRLELLPPGPLSACPVLLDGAHNPDKLRALQASLCTRPRRSRLHLVVGALAGRSLVAELRGLASLAETVLVTEPRVLAKPPQHALELARELGPGARALPTPSEALAAAAAAAAGPEDLIAVTGSLYLVGEVRGLFYPPQEVLAARTSWPGGAATA